MKYPKWIIEDIKKKKIDFYTQSIAIKTDDDLKEYKANTICYEAKCPNKGRCFKEKNATFLILGTICTRLCKFCSVEKGKPLPPDPLEPSRIANLVKKWGLSYVVFTSPTRDDLKDGGAEHFAKTITEIKKISPQTIVEPLIPDFKGSRESLRILILAEPEVVSHNIEMAERLYPEIRPRADYKRSLSIIKKIKELNPNIITKSSIITGLGETIDEIKKTINELKENFCDILVIGQYLNPLKESYPVKKFYSVDEFDILKEYALSVGFKVVISEPLARTSYRAYELYKKANQ